MNKLFTAALASLAFVGTATADQIYIDVGADYGGNTYAQGNGNTTTGWKNSLKLVFESNSTVTDVDGDGTISAGDTIVSTGGLGFGGTIANNKVTALIDGEGLLATDPSDNGYGSISSSWVLSFRFSDLMGSFDGTDFNYTSGNIDWLLFDITNGFGTEVHLFTTSIQSHSYTTGNQVFNGEIGNFGTDTVNGVAASDIFNIAYGNSSMTFEEYATTMSQNVRFRIDQNTDQPNVVGVDAQAGEIYISGKHDGSIEFAVPEPATIAILGLGLLGFAGASRRKS
ncbi:PEP-CTERM sorting domain-containing protein [Thalassotalea profundi]|nr:PEP-CTERM sorting domain-containing protein [Thalassotalea profundi]